MQNRNTHESRHNENNKPETDSSEIVRRHLEDENHEITDEDIRNVKVVGIDNNEPVTTGAELEARFGIDENSKEGDETKAPDPNDRPVTPWDVVSE
jgi:hypothetical protein